MRGQWMCLLLTLFSSIVHAQIFQASKDGGRIVASGEKGLFTIEELGRDADGWPEKRRTHTFANEQAAESYLRAAYPGRRDLRDDNGSGSALKGVGIPLWHATQTWDWNWEMKLADWVRQEVDRDFFVRYNLATDCADVAYALRWIFAREHGLPMSSRLASGDWFNEKTMRAHWVTLPTAKEWYNDKRFRAALDYILDFTYTHTLAQDAYPTAVNGAAILEGGFHLELHGVMGHTQPFTRIRRPGEKGLPIYILDSTVPRKVRPLHSTGYWVMQSPQPGKGGLLRFRWPASGRSLVAAAKMPYYSEEQYDPAFRNADEGTHYQAVFRHLDPKLTLEEIANELFLSVKEAVTQRIQVVDEGYRFCQTADCSPGTANYENWSTPSRDARLETMVSDLNTFIGMIGGAGDSLNTELNKEALRVDGIAYSYVNLNWALRNDTYSSDPRLPPDRRWGVSPAALEGMIRETARTKWTEREVLLAATSDCPATMCVPGLPEYAKNSSQPIDAKLLGLMRVANDYCGNMPFAACQDFQARLDAGFDLRGSGWSLRKTLDSFLTMLSDPRLSANERRNGKAKSTLLLDAALAADASTDFMRIGGSPLSLVDLRSAVPREMLPPAGSIWLDADLTAGRACHQGPAGTFERDLESGTDRAVVLGFTPLSMVFNSSRAGGGTIFIGKTEWAATDAAGAVKVRGDFTQLAIGYTYALIRENGLAYVLEPDARDGAKVTAVALPSGDPMPDVLHVTDSGWFYTSPNGPVLLRRDGGRVEYHECYNVLLVSSDGSAMIGQSNQTVWKYALGPAGEVLDKKELVGAPSYGMDASWKPVMITEDGEERSYYLRDGKLTYVAPINGEMTIGGAAGDLVFAYSPTGAHIRRMNGTLLYKLPPGHFVNQLHGDTGFVTICAFPTEVSVDSISTACRVENVFRQSEYSFATGLSMSPQLWRFLPSWIERGLRLNVAESSVWMAF